MPIIPIHSVTDSTFESHVLKSEKPVVVRFTAKNCPPCNQLSPYLKKLRNQYWQHITIVDYSLDAKDNSQKLYFKQYVPEQRYPVLVFFYQGKELNRSVGFSPDAYLALREEFVVFAAQTLGQSYQLPANYHEREAEFVEAATQASIAYETMMKPAIERWEKASFNRSTERVTAAAEARLRAGKITRAERDALINARQLQVMKQKNFQRALAKFRQALVSAEETLVASIEAAEHEFSLRQ